jgi:hypothetical protein
MLRGGDSSFYGFYLQASARVRVSVGGAVTDSYTFKAFGEEIAASGSTVNSLRYVGAFGWRARFDPVSTLQLSNRDASIDPDLNDLAVR